MRVLGIYEGVLNIDKITLHCKKDRLERLKSYRHLLSNDFVIKFRVDRGHWHGDEIHAINKNGLIYVVVLKTMELMTVFHPRPPQIKRYYLACGLSITETMLAIIDNCYLRNKKYKLNNK